jgi:hypothetical protein
MENNLQYNVFLPRQGIYQSCTSLEEAVSIAQEASLYFENTDHYIEHCYGTPITVCEVVSDLVVYKPLTEEQKSNILDRLRTARA